MTPVDDLTGTVFDEKYRILEFLGDGGVGCVYKAERLEIGKIVALKILKRPNEETLARFKREGRILCKLQQDNICQVFSIGATADGTSYMTLELIPGRSFDALLADGLVDRERAVSILHQIALALEYAHSYGVVHRDIKPSNVIVADSPDSSIPVAKMIDFGLARPDYENQSLTQSGEVLGTPQFIAPELWRGEAPSELSDIYSFGLLILTVADHVSLPESLITIGKKAAEQSPQRRYASFHQVVEALNCQYEPIAVVSRHGRFFAIVTILFLTSAAVWLVTSNQIGTTYRHFSNHWVMEEADRQLEAGNLARARQICAELMLRPDVDEADRSRAHVLTGCVSVLEKRSSASRKHMFRFNTSAEFWAAGSAEASRGRLNHARGLIEEYVVQCHVERNSSAAIEGYRMLANIAYLQGRMEERMELCRLRLAFWPELSDTTRKHLCKEILASVQQCKNVDTTLQVAVICQRDSSINKLIMPDFQPLLRAVAHECFRKKQWSDVLNILWFQLEHPDYISSSGVEEQLRLLYSTYRQRNEPSVDLAAVRTRESRQPKTSCINMALCCAFMGLGDFSSAIMPFRKVHTVPGFSRLFNEIYLEQITALTNQFDHERQCRQHVDILWSQMELSAYMAPYAAEDCMRNLFRAYRRINERSLALAAVRARESREPKTSFISMALCCAFMGLGDYNSAMKTFRKVRMVPGFSQLFREIYLEQIGALFEKRAVKASLDMVDFAVKQGVFTYSELHCTLGTY